MTARPFSAAHHGRGTMLPHRNGGFPGVLTAALAAAGTCWLASQAATARTSPGLSRRAMSAMQSGAWARRSPLRPGAELS